MTTTKARSYIRAHLALQACGRGLSSPKYVNQRPSRRLLGCWVQERQKRRAKISQYVSASPLFHDTNRFVILVAAAPNNPYHPLLRAIGPSNHAATASHAAPVFLFTLVVDCSSPLWDTVQCLLCRIFSTTCCSSNRLYRFNFMGVSSMRSPASILLPTLSTGDPDRIPVLGANYWPAAKMACLLHSAPHPDPTLSFAGDMLAGYTDHSVRS